MTAEFFFTLLSGYALLFSVMCVMWVLYRITKKPMIVDAGWGYAIAILGIFYAVTGSGDEQRRVVLAVMTGLAGIRLGSYLLFTRVLGRHHDARYDMLEAGWKKNIPFRYFMFYQSQAIAAVLVTVSFIVIARDSRPLWNMWEIAGVLVWFIAFIGQVTADAQLNAFKNDPANKGEVCRKGLWNYSRHPNYFFEWLMWMAYLLFAFSSDGAWIALLPPAIMLYLLLNVTGIPLTEENAIRSKGEKYKEYQRTTSAFVPWKKRN